MSYWGIKPIENGQFLADVTLSARCMNISKSSARRNISKSGVRRKISKSGVGLYFLWSCVRRAVRVWLCSNGSFTFLLYRVLTMFCHMSWPWPLPWTFDLEMILTLTFKWPLQNQRSKVKGHFKVKGHKVILQGHCFTLQISYCSWSWPLPWTFDLEMILTLTFKWPSQNFRPIVTQGQMSRSQGHSIPRS